MTAIKEGAPELADAFKAAEPGDFSRKQVKFHFSSSDYAQRQAKLEHLIEQTTYNMDLLASYRPGISLQVHRLGHFHV